MSTTSAARSRCSQLPLRGQEPFARVAPLLCTALLTFVAVFITMMRARGKLPTKVERLAPSPDRASASYRAHVDAQTVA